MASPAYAPLETTPNLVVKRALHNQNPARRMAAHRRLEPDFLYFSSRSQFQIELRLPKSSVFGKGKAMTLIRKLSMGGGLLLCGLGLPLSYIRAMQQRRPRRHLQRVSLQRGIRECDQRSQHVNLDSRNRSGREYGKHQRKRPGTGPFLFRWQWHHSRCRFVRQQDWHRHFHRQR